MPVDISWPVVAAIVHPNVGGWIGGLITRKNFNPWYESLVKPKWTPPKWAFAPVWTSLYCSMGYASYIVVKESGSCRNAAFPLSIYATNLALNWAWTPIFFGTHEIKWAFYEIIGLWGTTAALSIAFYRVNATAGLLIVPYLAWTTLATALNYVIYRDNELNKTTKAIEEKEN